jgi:hypothetical protein
MGVVIDPGQPLLFLAFRRRKSIVHSGETAAEALVGLLLPSMEKERK